MAHSVAPAAERDLDGIWYYVATQSSSIEIANRLIDSITERFLLLARFPYMGRSREPDLDFPCRSSAVGEYVIVYCVEGDDVLILRVVHGRRDLDALFSSS
jgi:toxin ParE1/3/4